MLDELEKLINYKFLNKSILKNAFIHSSYANESVKNIKSNERLEFLGDAVLGIVIAEHLYKNFNNLDEGEMSKYRSYLVCGKTLYIHAKRLELNKYLKVGKGDINVTHSSKKSILSNSLEALIGAIFIDGGLEESKKFILNLLNDDINNFRDEIIIDYKQHLIKILNIKENNKVVKYKLVETIGPDHGKKFVVEAFYCNKFLGRGSDYNKKSAEQNAAKNAINRISK